MAKGRSGCLRPCWVEPWRQESETMREWHRWEVGSMFHWDDNLTPPFWTLPTPSRFYLLCRHAIADLCASRANRPVLWLPTFLCPEIAHFCRKVAILREYRDDCRWPEPDWCSLRPGDGDMVLAVNYFGVRGAEPWRDWSTRNPGSVLIEDHTQDPLSSWAINSLADYAVCSLRKTLPVPDGAMLWSPSGRSLPPIPHQGCWQGSFVKLGAMLYKKQYLEGTVPASIKSRYREWQLVGEQQLSETEISTMSPVAEAILSRGIPKSWRECRMQNARILLSQLSLLKVAQPVFTSWPEGHAPFDVPLVFPSQSERD